MLKYTLMHKNVAVADIEIDEALGGVTKIRNITAKEHLPVGIIRIQRDDEVADRYAFNQWWTGRSIPASRMGVSDALETLGIYNTKLLLTKCLGLSPPNNYLNGEVPLPHICCNPTNTVTCTDAAIDTI